MNPQRTASPTAFRWPTAAAALFALGLALAAPAAAGTIGFRTDAEVSSGPGVEVKVTLTHTGDEVAENVLVVAEMLDRAVQGKAIPALGPRQTHSWKLHLFDDVPPGVYAVVIRTRYADTNGYPFEVISTATAAVNVKPAVRLFGGFQVPRLQGKTRTTARLTVKRPPGRAGDAEALLVAPVGLDLDKDRVPLRFDEGGKASATFAIRNSKLLAGTTVNVFALIRATDPGFPQVDTIRGNVRIAAASARIRTPIFYRAAAALFALLVVLELGAWVRGRREAT